jgi:hypothetical protein
MYTIKSNTAEEMKMANSSSAYNKTASEAVNKYANNVVDVNYPFSFLLLENEEDSFVKGYN